MKHHGLVFQGVPLAVLHTLCCWVFAALTFRLAICRGSPLLQCAVFVLWPGYGEFYIGGLWSLMKFEIFPLELKSCRTLCRGDVIWAGLSAGLGKGPAKLRLRQAWLRSAAPPECMGVGPKISSVRWSQPIFELNEWQQDFKRCEGGIGNSLSNSQ